MTDETKAEVFEIDLNKKYVLVIKERLSTAQRASLLKTISDWTKAKDQPLLVIAENVELVKISEDEENN